MSRGFGSTLFGTAITIFAWFSPWSWPAWPALGVLRLLWWVNPAFGPLIVLLCIAINVAAWALLFRAVQWLIARWRVPAAG